MAHISRSYINNKAAINKNILALEALRRELQDLNKNRLTKVAFARIYGASKAFDIIRLHPTDTGVQFKSNGRKPFHAYNEKLISQMGMTGMFTSALSALAEFSEDYRDCNEANDDMVQSVRGVLTSLLAIHQLLKLVVVTPPVNK